MFKFCPIRKSRLNFDLETAKKVVKRLPSFYIKQPHDNWRFLQSADFSGDGNFRLTESSYSGMLMTHSPTMDNQKVVKPNKDFVGGLKEHAYARLKRFLTRYSFLRFSFCFWCITMYTLAMDFLTTLIFDSFDAAPPVTFATLKDPSSVFRSSSCFVSSSFFLVRKSEHLIFGCKNQQNISFG